MRYIKLSFKYLIKNGLFLFLLGLIPAIFIGLVLSPFKFLEFINNYTSIAVVNFGNIFFGVVDISWLKLLFYVLAFALLGICVSVIIGFIENHFRSGKRNYYSFKNYINNNILVVLLNLITISVLNFVLQFLCATLIYLFHLMFAGVNASANVGSLIVAIIIFVLYFIISSIYSMVLTLNIPNMMINGYTFKQSLSSTINSLTKNFINLLLAFLLPFILIIPLISIFNFSGVALSIVNCICVLISIMYYSALVMTAYFDINNINRYDNRKYYSIK